MRRFLVILCIALLAGCGGGGGRGDSKGGGGSGGGGGSKAGGAVEDQLAFDMGFQQCTGYSVTDLAATYGTKPTADAVATKVAATTPTQAPSRPSIKQGCLAGLKGK